MPRQTGWKDIRKDGQTLFHRTKNKFNSELVHNKKYLKAEKNFNIKKSFQCFYILILIGSVYRKDDAIILKFFLEKFIHNFFGEV